MYGPMSSSNFDSVFIILPFLFIGFVFLAIVFSKKNVDPNVKKRRDYLNSIDVNGHASLFFLNEIARKTNMDETLKEKMMQMNLLEMKKIVLEYELVPEDILQTIMDEALNPYYNGLQKNDDDSWNNIHHHNIHQHHHNIHHNIHHHHHNIHNDIHHDNNNHHNNF